MAVSQIEEKILGRLAKLTEPSNPLLSASLYQVLGLSILLSRKLYRARRLRRLDLTRNTKSLQLYHHIIWLAREGLSITEVYILPYCEDGENGPECRIMAAKLRASFYHVFCLFHNHPPIGQLNGRSGSSASPPSKSNTPSIVVDSPSKSTLKEGSRQRVGKPPLRDPIPSIQSDASFVTNPYASGTARTPPPGLAILPPENPRRTPSRPPGLAPVYVSAAQSAASFLLPPLNFVPMAQEHFEVAQQLCNNLLPVTHALRLSVSLEHAAFLWDCASEHDGSRRLAQRTIKDVYSSSDGLDDDEFADASVLVQALGGMVKRGSNESTPQQPVTQAESPTPRAATRSQPALNIDRTIAVSPPTTRGRPSAQQATRSTMRTPERLSTVPEAEVEGSEAAANSTAGALSPPVSRLSSRSRPGRASSATSAASDKASKRKLVEQAEERVRRRQRSASNASRTSGSRRNSNTADGSGSGGSQKAHSRQQTPTEGYVRPQQQSDSPTKKKQKQHQRQ
ncbi:Putative 14-3-3 protein [Septoria linicola]|uniref:14-3-3 protein n=1 Tax=Septoria linicola TaxID=215465 RepID=A0A9Q9EFP5_9PEZI|nr:putative 14-3-3 protein [Septoria linicola]USW47463.1 Putative 14-3-3 protein [Septoria linicola]